MYTASKDRYQNSALPRRCGRSGVILPKIALGLWHNFGGVDQFENGRAIVRRAFDLGVFHFDLANNYGPPAGSAEETFGKILRQDLPPYRDELILSTKAGWYMWPGPFGERSSRKSMLASLDQSLGRMGVDYVDIYYAQRWDEHTLLEETMGALAHAVRVGKALYIGVSGYSPEQTTRAAAILRGLGVTPIIHQPRYSMFDRSIEGGLLDVLEQEGMGCIPFSRSRRACSPTATSTASPPTPAPVAPTPNSLSPTTSRPPSSPKSPPSTTSPPPAASRSPAWRSPGSCVTLA